MSSTHETTPSAAVLLVQPEHDDREMYAEFLRHAGLTPMLVSNATPALALAADADVIVTGLMLPGPMDGIELLALLKRDDRTRHIPVIVLTSCAWSTERQRAEGAGCDLFLAKPCLPEVLLREVVRLLRSSERQKARRKAAKASMPHVRGRAAKRRQT